MERGFGIQNDGAGLNFRSQTTMDNAECHNIEDFTTRRMTEGYIFPYIAGKYRHI